MASLGQTAVRGGAGTAAGLGGTVLMREWADNPADDSITRPSVLYGVGTGALSLGAVIADGRGVLDIPDAIKPALNAWGTTGITAGLFSAAFPKGADESVLPLNRVQQIRA